MAVGPRVRRGLGRLLEAVGKRGAIGPDKVGRCVVSYVVGDPMPASPRAWLIDGFGSELRAEVRLDVRDQQELSKSLGALQRPRDADIWVLVVQLGRFDGLSAAGSEKDDRALRVLDHRGPQLMADHRVLVTALPECGSGRCDERDQAINTSNRAWVETARRHDFDVIDLFAKVLRWGPEKFRDGDGRVNDRAIRSMARALSRNLAEFLERHRLQAGRQASEFELGMIGSSALSAFGRPPGLPLMVAQPGADATARAQRMLSGELVFKKLAELNPVPFRVPVDWGMSVPNRTWLTLFHALEMIQDLVAAYRQSGEAKFLEFGLSVIVDWVRSNPPTASRGGRAWHEGTVAKRVINLAYFLNAFLRSSCATEGAARTLRRVVDQHCEFLMGESTYRPEGNHGLRQDYALLSIALQFPDLPGAASWEASALRRIRERQLSMVCPQDGVYLEHSTDYHFLAMNLYLAVAKLFIGAHRQVPDFLVTTVARMLRFAAYVVQPNGLVPPIGDSEGRVAADVLGWIEDLRESRETIGPLAQGAEELAFSVSAGERGRPPTEVDGLFPAAGWAIFRDAWRTRDDFADGVYLNFHATLHSAKHKHADDLSFVLYGFGREWLIDGGKYNYEVNDELRHHLAYDASAHNSFTQDGRTYDIAEGARKRLVAMTQAVSEPGYGYAKAVNRAYPRGAVERTVVFIRRPLLVVLFDKFSAAGETSWETYFHFAEDLSPVLTQRGITCEDGRRGALLEIVVAGEGPMSQDIFVGSERPLLGWRSPRFGTRVPAPVVVQGRRGREVLAVTVVRLAGRADGRIGEVCLERSRDRDTVDISLGGEQVRVTCARGGGVDVVGRAWAN